MVVGSVAKCKVYYTLTSPPIPVYDKLCSGAPVKFDPYGLVKEKNPRLWRAHVSTSAPSVTFFYKNCRYYPADVVENPVNPAMIRERVVSECAAPR